MGVKSSEKYGKLYTFFLDVAKLYVNDRLHLKLKVPKEGRAMYKHLKKELSKEDDEIYKEVINNCSFLSDQQKEYLLPDSEVINLEKLDFTMCVNIMRLLETKKKEVRLRVYLKR